MEFSLFRPWGEIVDGMNEALRYSEVDSLRLGRWKEKRISFLERLGKRFGQDASMSIGRGSFDLVRTNEIGLLHWGAERTVGKIDVDAGHYAPFYDDGFYERVNVVIRDSLDFGGRIFYPFKIEMEKNNISDKLIRKDEFYGKGWRAGFLGELFRDECFVK